MHQLATVSVFVRASAKICFCNVSQQVLSEVKALQNKLLNFSASD